MTLVSLPCRIAIDRAWKRENKNTHKTLNIEQSIGIVTLLFCLWISLMNIKVSKSIKYTPIQFSRGQNLFPLTYNSLFTSHVFDRRWIRYLLIEILFFTGIWKPIIGLFWNGIEFTLFWSLHAQSNVNTILHILSVIRYM